MTRINAGIHPSELCDQHLIAEYRELPRIHNLVWKHSDLRSRPSVPEFKLGKGHCLFFIDKGLYLHFRWIEIQDEMNYRGFKTNLVWRHWPLRLYNSWTETEAARDIVRERIRERLRSSNIIARWTKRSKPAWIEDV